MAARGEQRRAPRAKLQLGCTLRRPVGRPVRARTIDLGPGGMLVASERPLALDEALDFELAGLEAPLRGQAHVVRHEQLDRYALAFERLDDDDVGRLRRLADGG